MSSIVNVLSCTIFACARNAGGTMLRASSLLSTSTNIHALCTPSLHPHSVRLKKWDPVLRKTWTARAHAVGVPSCGTSMRNLAVISISPLLQPRPFPSYCSVAGLTASYACSQLGLHLRLSVLPSTTFPAGAEFDLNCLSTTSAYPGITNLISRSRPAVEHFFRLGDSPHHLESKVPGSTL